MNITDIAALAGVSKAAVSRYFNKGYLSEEKRKAIEKVVNETHYQPDPQAQNLRARRNRQIGVVIPKLSSESVARVMDGISSVLTSEEYQVILANTSNDPAKEVEYLDLLRHHHVEGVIFLASIFTSDHNRILQNMHIPVVIVGQRYTGCSCVYHNDRGAAKELVRLMIERGCRRPGYIGVTKKDRAAGYERLQGYLSALKEGGIRLCEQNMSEGQFTSESGFAQAAKLLDRTDPPDGIFCATDNIAIGVIQYCKEHGIRVPDDLLIAGVGDSKLGSVCAVPLTSAHMFYRTAGEEAAKLMLGRLRTHDSGAARSLMLGFDIVERESTAGLKA